MFCTKCGAQLEDGAKFCTGCGAQTRFAQVPTPEATAPAAPAAPATPAAPSAPQTPAWSAPASQTPPAPTAPQAPAWGAPQTPAQSASPQAGSWQTPQQTRQPQQAPQQWQQPQQQWQAPQQTPQQWQQPQQQQPQWQQIQQQWQASPQGQQARQQQWQQPTRSAYPQQKKGKGGLIAGIIALVLVLVIGVGGFVWPGFFRGGKGDSSSSGGGSILSGGSSSSSSSAGTAKIAKSVVNGAPEDYYQAVETNSADRLTAHAASVYDNFLLSNATSEDISSAGKVSLEPGDKLRELLADALGEQLAEINPGDDFKWLKSIAADYDISRKGDMMGLNIGITLNGKDLIHVAGMMQEGGALVLKVPELSDQFFEIPPETLEDMDLGSLNLGSNAMLGSLLSSLNIEDTEKLDPVSKALPDAKTAEKILNKYLKEAVDLIEKVDKTEQELSVEGVSATYTVLANTIDADTANKIIQKLGPELKEDKDIQKIIKEVAAAAGQDAEAKYQEFIDKIDAYINDPEKIKETLTEDLIVTVYLDKNSEVHGRIIESGNSKLELLMPESGSEFGLLIRYTDDGTEKLLMQGSGKRSGDKLTGDLDLTYEDEYYGVVGLDGFDIEKVKDGYFVGGLNLKPSASVWSKLLEKADEEDKEIPESIRSILDTLVFHVDLNTAKDKGDIALTVTNGSDKFFTISLNGSKGAAKKIDPAEGIEASEWAQGITLDQMEKVVASLEKAGVPQAYTDKLDEALEESFS